MRLSAGILSFVAIGTALLGGHRAVAAVDFVHQVAPVLKEYCGKCHMEDKKKGSLSMNTEHDFLAGGEDGKIAVAGDSAHSKMIELILSTDKEEWMPPKGDRVPAEKVAILKEWINGGMKWEPGYSFDPSRWEPPLKPRQVTLPPAKGDRTNPIDRILDAGLVNDGIKTPAIVSDAVFLRRATLDATGLLPSPKELEEFVADTRADKRSRKIAQLLADDVGYADHWLTTWNDLLRNDYTGTGFITGGRKQITTWLYASLRDNKPYDQMVRELVAPTADSAGFIDGIKWRGEVNSSQSVEIQFSQNVAQVFLGINMKCASCHDSFIDRWKLQEAYNLAAIYSDHPLELNRCDKPTGKMAVPKWLFPEIGDVDPKAAKPERLKQLAALMTHPDNGRFSRTIVNRMWHRLMGRGIAHPVDAMEARPWNEDLLDYLAVRFAEDRYDLRKLIGLIMESRAYQSEAVILAREPGQEYRYAGPVSKRMTAEQFLDCVWQITGSAPTKMEAKVDRSARAAAAAVATNPDRVMAAKWIWSYPDTSGTAAGEVVTLRRQFAMEKGFTGGFIVITCDNEYVLKLNGKQVGADTDWPTVERYDVKALLKNGENTVEVVCRNAGSGPNAAGLYFQMHIGLADGKELKILSDESWQAKAADGKWPAAAVLTNQGFLGGRADGAIIARLQEQGMTGPGNRFIRAALVQNDFLMRSLGRPHRDQVVTTRPAELTTLQAIDLSNGDVLAGYLAAGVPRLAGDSPVAMVDNLYEAALGRAPSADERGILVAMLGDKPDKTALEDLLWTVFMLPEFQVVR